MSKRERIAQIAEEIQYKLQNNPNVYCAADFARMYSEVSYPTILKIVRRDCDGHITDGSAHRVYMY